MKTSFIALVGIGLLLLTSSWENGTSVTIENGTFWGFVQDEELNEEYYSFETETNYIDFYQISPSVLKLYNLKTAEFEGSTFEIEYAENEDGENVLQRLKLIKKSSPEE